MKFDPSGHWALPKWAETLISLTGPAGWAFVGANRAYETSKALDKNGWETFGWTVSGIFAGDYFVVKNNWSEVEKTINMDGQYNFKFQNNRQQKFQKQSIQTSPIRFYQEL